MVTEVEQNLSNAAHANPADTYKMDMLNLPLSIHLNS